jgi:hypothetical protein
VRSRQITYLNGYDRDVEAIRVERWHKGEWKFLFVRVAPEWDVLTRRRS